MIADKKAALALSLSDLSAEGLDLYTLMMSEPAETWQRETQFKRWSVWDIFAHLAHVDAVGLALLRRPERADALITEVAGDIQQKGGLIAANRAAMSNHPGASLLAQWWSGFQSLCDAVEAADPGDRLPWFGPPMGVRMFATARQMEIWAHSHAIYDLTGRDRRDTDRLRGIVSLGVRTFGWSFTVRGEAAPEHRPALILTAPSGALWDMGGDPQAGRIEGSAADFCRVVTQVRHIDDTALTVEGDVAHRWMQRAQCFAGLPEDPPEPGSRVRA